MAVFESIWRDPNIYINYGKQWSPFSDSLSVNDMNYIVSNLNYVAKNINIFTENSEEALRVANEAIRLAEETTENSQLAIDASNEALQKANTADINSADAVAKVSEVLEEVKNIPELNIDEKIATVEGKIPQEYVKDATVADDTLTITKQDGSTIEFQGGGGGSIQIIDIGSSYSGTITSEQLTILKNDPTACISGYGGLIYKMSKNTGTYLYYSAIGGGNETYPTVIYSSVIYYVRINSSTGEFRTVSHAINSIAEHNIYFTTSAGLRGYFKFTDKYIGNYTVDTLSTLFTNLQSVFPQNRNIPLFGGFYNDGTNRYLPENIMMGSSMSDTYIRSINLDSAGFNVSIKFSTITTLVDSLNVL